MIFHIVGSSELRVTINNRRQTNEIASSELSTLEYKVNLPSAVCEIAGVVTEGSMTCDDLKEDIGRAVEILDCKQNVFSVVGKGETRLFDFRLLLCDLLRVRTT